MNIIIVTDNFSGHLFHDIELFIVAFEKINTLQTTCTNVYITVKTTLWSDLLSMKLFRQTCQVTNTIDIGNSLVIDRNKLNCKSINKVFADSIYQFPTKLWSDCFHTNYKIGKNIKILYPIRKSGRSLDATSHNKLCSILRRFDQSVTICDMGTMPIETQLEIFRNHNVVIGVHGNNLSGIMWMNPESFVFEILPIKFKPIVYDYHCMSLCMKHNYTQIDCTGEKLNSVFTLNDTNLFTICSHLNMLSHIYS